MPHVIVKIFPGASEAQKRALTEAVTRDVMEHLGKSEASVSVALEEIAREDWKAQVYDTEIAPMAGKLYKEPGYTM